MIQDIALALWFFLPAGLANVAPVLAAKIPGLAKWDAPMDGGRNFQGQPLLGPHKTWRGLLAGAVLATLAFYLQQQAVGSFGWAHWAADEVDYDRMNALIIGPLFALGALGGDAVESFFKRRRGLRSGQAWLGFDQLDYVLGAIILTFPVARLTLVQYGWVIAVWFALHLVFSYVGYLIGLKDEPI